MAAVLIVAAVLVVALTSVALAQLRRYEANVALLWRETHVVGGPAIGPGVSASPVQLVAPIIEGALSVAVLVVAVVFVARRRRSAP